MTPRRVIKLCDKDLLCMKVNYDENMGENPKAPTCYFVPAFTISLKTASPSDKTSNIIHSHKRNNWL